MSCDPQQLVDDAKCIEHCIPHGLRWPTLIYLFCQIANREPPAECINIVPGDATYFEGNYSLLAVAGIPLIVGAQYTITFGANDLEVTNLGQPDIVSPGPGIPVVFTATNANLIFDAAPGHISDPVTATLCVVPQPPVMTPTNLDIDVTGLTSDSSTFFAKLTWQSANVPERFEIWRQVNSGSYALLAIVSGGILTYSDDCRTQLLMPDYTFHTYKVRAKTGASFSSFSNEIQACKGTIVTADAVTVNRSYPLLVVSFFEMTFNNNPAMVSLSLPKLKADLNHMLVDSNPLLTSFSAPFITECGYAPGFEDFTIINNPKLVTLDISSIVNINSGALNLGSNALLTTITFNAAPTIPDVGNSIVSQFCNLSAATVNRILAICVANGLTQAFIALDGVSNSAPTGQGVLDKGTLIVNGCTVNTN